jgi:hypothetical protein
MSDLAAEIAEYLAGERQATEPNELCRLIYLEAAHNTQWTKATFEQWEEALEQAIKRGLIERKGNKVAVPSKHQSLPKLSLDYLTKECHEQTRTQTRFPRSIDYACP